MASAMHAMLAAFMLWSAEGFLVVKQPDALTKAQALRTMAVIRGRSLKAAAFLEGQAKKLAVPEMELLALRVAQINATAGDLSADYKELRTVLRKVVAGGAPHLQEFCAAEKKRTGQQFTKLQDMKKKSQTHLSEMAAEADRLGKEVAGLKAATAKTRRKLATIEREKAQDQTRYAQSGAHHLATVQLPKKVSLNFKGVQMIAAAQTKASEALLHRLKTQMRQATFSVHVSRKERQLKVSLKFQESAAKQKEQKLNKLKTDLVQQAQDYQCVEGKAAASERYMQEVGKKCGSAAVVHTTKQQGQDQVTAIKATYQMLSGS